MKKLLAVVLSVLALGFASSGARADPIGPTCGTCQGGIYTLFSDFVDTNGDPGFETYRVSLLIDTSNLTIAAVGIDTVAVKIASAITGFSLVTAPAGSGAWSTFLESTLNASGCSATGGGGWGCATTLPSGTAAATGGDLEWIFDITLAAGDLIDPASIKVRYVDGQGNKIGDLVSENIELQESPCIPGTPGCRPPFLISEPSPLLLVGLALVAVGAVGRRRIR